MSQMMDEAAWKSLSEEFPWSEQLLEKYKEKVDWTEVSDNRNMLWTASMLEKFRGKIDWERLSRTGHECILTADMFERFKANWDWRELSGNSSIEFTYELLDRFADLWDWSQIIDNYGMDKLFSIEFLDRYAEHIPASQLQHSHLWLEIINQRATEISREITA